VTHPRTIVVPQHVLSGEALRGVIEEFVTRPGTDYGTQERTLDAKIADVARQLECGDAIIVFDVDAGTTNIVPHRRTRS
jgi:uncharacterized protein YheU (UPF0270 family)